MKKKILEAVERFLAGLLSTLTCMGAFLVIYFLTNLFYSQKLQSSEIFALFTASVIISYFLINGYEYVRYKRLEILADELEQEKDEQAEELYKHLEV